MGNAYAKFKFDVGDIIDTFGRNLMIIDRKYVDKISYKNGKEYNVHYKYYKYRCLDCKNEDWLIEYLLTSEKQHYGCNACCNPPRKLVVGVNDIATIAPWMIKYFINPNDVTKYFKFSKEKVNMLCPDCGRKHITTPHNVYNNHGLTCPCQDGWSYPNKFMYAMLEQIGVNFQAEKMFNWSDERKYDNYIEYKGMKIITEQHGQQHYFKQFSKNGRTVEEEKENDEYKYHLAMSNGIDKYFVIDSSISSMEYMRKSIEESKLLVLLDKTSDDINWIVCDEFASSNLVKKICIYKQEHSNVLLRDIANIHHISYKTVLDYIKKGSKLGWCSYELFDDLRMLREQGKVITNQRPIHCISDGKYYRCSTEFVQEYEKEYGKRLNARNIRAVCEGKRNYVNNLKFEYITQEEFNNIKTATPELVIGEFFKLKETA